tara:strand:+ start:16 stop:297 length:282 start_codon:yes stop_codon:yes gene_type:complete
MKRKTTLKRKTKKPNTNMRKRTKIKPMEIDADTLKMWHDADTHNALFSIPLRTYRSYSRKGHKCRIIWQSKKYISVTPLPKTQAVRIRKRKMA